jgi:dTMP kinase
LAAGKVVVLDRYYFSTMAYQGSRGFDPAAIRRDNEAFAPVPDLLLILDLGIDQALARIGGRGDTANAFEKRDALERCRAIFLALGKEPGVRVVDTAAPEEEVHRQIVAEVARMLEGSPPVRCQR